jgi:hypothetical protein
MNDSDSTRWAQAEREREIAYNRQTLNARTALAKERSRIAREQRIAEASVRQAMAAAWPGTKQQFEAAWPGLYQDFLKEKAARNLAKVRAESPAAGAI